MRTEITPGQTSDYFGFDLMMGDNLLTPSVLLADRSTILIAFRKTWRNGMSCRSSRCATLAKSGSARTDRSTGCATWSKGLQQVANRPPCRHPLRLDYGELHRHHVDPAFFCIICQHDLTLPVFSSLLFRYSTSNPNRSYPQVDVA